MPATGSARRSYHRRVHPQEEVPRSSWFRRRPGLTALVVFAVAAVVTTTVLFFAGPDGHPSTIGGNVSPPPCEEPGGRETVGPQPWMAFRFQVPDCFQLGDELLEPASGEPGQARVVVIPIDLELVANTPVAAQITVSAAGISADDAARSDEEMQEQLLRGAGFAGSVKEGVRREVDGARGFGIRITRAGAPVGVVWAFVKGTTQVTVVCRWRDDVLNARMLAGCNQVVDTLTIA